MRLGTAFVLSVIWHVFWISSVQIVSLPARVQYPRFADVAFIGSFQDEPHFEVHVTPLPPPRSPSGWFHQPVSRSAAEEFPPRTPFSFEISLPESERPWQGPGEFLGLEKKNPVSLSEKTEEGEIGSFPLEGPASSRILYYRPPLPVLPKWADLQQTGSSLEFRFWVSPRGKVVGVEKVTSAGDPTLDTIAMRYLRRWQFNPKNTPEDEWGKVALQFPFQTPREEK